MASCDCYVNIRFRLQVFFVTDHDFRNIGFTTSGICDHPVDFGSPCGSEISKKQWQVRIEYGVS